MKNILSIVRNAELNMIQKRTKRTQQNVVVVPKQSPQPSSSDYENPRVRVDQSDQSGTDSTTTEVSSSEVRSVMSYDDLSDTSLVEWECTRKPFTYNIPDYFGANHTYPNAYWISESESDESALTISDSEDARWALNIRDVTNPMNRSLIRKWRRAINRPTKIHMDEYIHQELIMQKMKKQGSSGKPGRVARGK